MLDIYNMFSIQGKNALITGSANGNGKALSSALGDAGCNLTLIDIDNENLEVVSKEIEEKTKTKVNRYSFDLSDSIQLDSFLQQNNDFDIVINNAGVTYGNHLFDYKDSDWEKTYRINLFAPYKIIQKIGETMTKKKSGSIINITSLAAEFGFPGNPAYIAFKGALKQLTKSAAYDLSKFNIRVNSVGPGYIKTNMTAKSWDDKKMKMERSDRTMLGRWGESEDLIGTVIFLSSDASSYITGQDFYVDGGWTAKGL